MFILTLSFTLNGPIIVWSSIPAHIITMPPPSCLLWATCTSELDKIHLLARPSGPSNVTQDSPEKMSLEKSIFMHFFPKFDSLKISALERGFCQGGFLQIPIHKVFNAFCLSWLPQLQRSERWSKVSVLL